MVRSGDTGHGDTEACRRNFCAVQEVGTEESDRDEEVEQENEESRGNLSRHVALGETASDSKGRHTSRHSCTAEHEQLAASESVDGEECHETRQELPGQGTTAEDAGSLSVHTKTLLEDNLS